MYQPNDLDALISEARDNGHTDLVKLLINVQNEMLLRNYIEGASDNVKLGWRGNHINNLSTEDLTI